MMVRLYKDYAELLLLALMYIRDQGMQVKDLLYRYKIGGERSHKNDSEAAIRASQNLINSHVGDTHISELVEKLKNVINAAQMPNADGNVIDEIIRLLGIPFGRHDLDLGRHGSVREAVAKVLMLPSELTALKAVVDHIETRCSDCRRPLEDGEMITYTKGADRNEHTVPKVYCIQCIRPVSMPCGTCDRQASLSKSLRGVLNKLRTCDACIAAALDKGKLKEAQKPVPVATEPVQGQAEATLGTLYNVNRTTTPIFRVDWSQVDGTYDVNPPDPNAVTFRQRVLDEVERQRVVRTDDTDGPF